MAISNENPNFVDGEDGGCGSVSAALLSSASADLVSAPIATFLMAGGSHGVRCSLLVWPVLPPVMGASAKITTQAFYEITSGVARRRQSPIGGHTRATQTFHPRLLTKKKCCIARSDVRSQPLGIQDSA